MGKVYDREPFDRKPQNTSKETVTTRLHEKRATRRGALIRESTFQFNVKCELLDFYVNYP